MSRVADFAKPKNTTVTLSPADQDRLAAAIEKEQRTTAIYQAAEMRLRADVLDAQREKSELLKELGKTYHITITPQVEYTGATGVLTAIPPKD